ncbi:photosynthetic complex assembly protein PuhC [Acuticoccus sp. MNP-M23]|uniref:photosynthetic complex assembly protein PuhC n=1 Tax=Acuticoccus sp. MNP-M23 TaxID=3072793 RepID=UPI002814D92E|nr:photosynthetic complex assembly protein PuhC [Acuticoccus sp. MNP-M23]WMS41910.1 photosynthetic complex assembly protein PuhC [Acuticoccus sp. MNP-M23]
MSDEPIRVPRGALVAAAVLIAFVFTATIVARQTDRGIFRPANAAVEASRAIRFVRDDPQGPLVAYSLDGQALATFPIEGGSFAIAAVEALSRKAHRRIDGDGAVFTLRLGTDHRWSLSDPSTERAVPLAGFGSTNIKAFSNLMSEAPQ